MVHNKRFFFKKKINREMETLMKMSYSFGSALLSMNPKQFAIDSLPIVKKICCYNFRNSVPSLRIFTSGSINFGMTGLSLKTSQKMLEISEEAGIENDVVGFASFLMIDKMQNYYTGRWHTKEDRLRTINKEIRAGSFWDTTGYNCYSGLAYIETGEYVNFIVMHNMLQEQAENYNSSYAVSLAYRLKANGFYKFRKLDDFIKIEEEGEKQISNTDNLAHLVVFHSIQSLVHLRLGNFNKAEKAISKAKKLQEKVSNIPIFHTHYLLAIVHFDLEKILKLKEKEPQYKAMVKEINRNSKKLIAKSKKMIANLTEAYLLRSRIFMFQQKFKKAFKNLQLAVQTGEKYNGRLELSRAYFETGKFLSNPKTKQEQLNGLSGKDYLEKAKTLFEEIDLQWDLGEYKKFVEHRKNFN
jgi:tetratricopeptide (TPR) repeat protein